MARLSDWMGAMTGLGGMARLAPWIRHCYEFGIKQTERAENVSKLSGVNETLSLSVIRLERLHEVGKRARVRLVTDCFVDRQNLLECVLLFACLATIITIIDIFIIIKTAELAWHKVNKNASRPTIHSDSVA